MLYGGQLEPQGFSFFTEVKISTTSMYENLLANITPDCETEEERAILRYVEELKL